MALEDDTGYGSCEDEGERDTGDCAVNEVDRDTDHGAVGELDGSADGSDAESGHSAQQRRARLFEAASTLDAAVDNAGAFGGPHQAAVGSVGAFGVPFRAPGPPKLCRDACGRACNV